MDNLEYLELINTQCKNVSKHHTIPHKDMQFYPSATTTKNQSLPTPDSGTKLLLNISF